MSNSVRQEVFQYLASMAEKHGVIPVRDAANQFLKMKLKAVTAATIRRPIPRVWVEKAFIRQKGKCSRCHESMTLDEATGDHSLPLALGGLHNQGNITAMHRRCNSSKGDNDTITESKTSGNLIKDIFPDEE